MSFPLPSHRPCPDGALVVPPHRSIWVCLLFFSFFLFCSFPEFKSTMNFFFFFKSPCTNFYNRNYCFGLIFGWVSVSLVWCCTTWYVCFSPLMYCYLNPQRTCFLSPCKNFYSKNYLFVLIFGLGLCEIIVFFLISMCRSLGV